MSDHSVGRRKECRQEAVVARRSAVIYSAENPRSDDLIGRKTEGHKGGESHFINDSDMFTGGELYLSEEKISTARQKTDHVI